MDIIVTQQSGHHGSLRFLGRDFECALGPAGIITNKREGDGATPAGKFPLRAVWFRADRVQQPDTALPVVEIQPEDGWCDAPEDPNYNRRVQLPYPASAERMWREDSAYDLVIVVGHNDDPVVPGQGSAIFLHVASPSMGPTEGCVALDQDDILTVINGVALDSMIEIRGK